MGYWGLRHVCAAFVSVWVVGCSITHDAAPTLPPTRLPPVTLTMQISSETSPPPTPIPPPASPTPEPTAIVYSVQPGDTLLAIAVQYGVELKDLQAANPPL